MKPLSGTLGLGVALSAVTACSSDGDVSDDAELSIVGDRSLYLENGERTDLEVRYHDELDEPLHGTVQFSVDGDAQGAELTSATAGTDDNGIASVTLDGSAEEQASFTVSASAPDADAVSFNVTIEEPAAPLDPEGTYEVHSTFNLVDGLEDGTVKDVVDHVTAFADDPGAALLGILYDLAEDILPSDLDRDQVELIGSALTIVLENEFEEFGEILSVAQDINDVLHNFEVVSELEVNGSRQSLSSDHSLTGVVIPLGNEEYAFTMSDLEVDDIDAYSVSADLTEDESELTVERHSLPVAYGAMLRIVLNKALVNAIDSDADDLADLLEGAINGCDNVADRLKEQLEEWEVPFISDIPESFFDAACGFAINQGVEQLFSFLEDQFEGTAVEFRIEGTARPVDTDNDGLANVLRDGIWEGEVTYADEGVAAELSGSDNEFHGDRIDD